MLSSRVCYLYDSIIAGVFLLAIQTAFAQIQDDWPASLDANSAQVWADQLFSEALTKGGLDGAVVAIVKDGTTLYQTGYGLADVVEQIPATANTPFRSGSISKLFTAISILQLAERGLLNLDDDINQHISRTGIETTQGRTTIRHLLTHTAGFEEKFRNTLVAEPETERATPDYIQRHAHEQVRRPGTVISYSNHGMGIAGVIIEEVSGQTYGDYVSENIFSVLGMTSAGVEFPGKLPSGIASEYDLRGGRPVPRQFLFKQPFYLGSGGFFYSANDMAAFMKAVLSRSPALLSAASWEQAWTLQASAGEGFGGGIGLGFWHYEPGLESGPDAAAYPAVAGHGGSTEGFQSRLFLFPRERIGLFFSIVNSGNTDQRPFDTWNGAWDFVETFRGYQQFSAYEGESTVLASQLSGDYISNRRPYAGAELFLNTMALSTLSLSAREGVLYDGEDSFSRIGPRSFARLTESGRAITLSFSEDLNTVYTGASSSFTRTSSLNPSLYFVPLVLTLSLIALSGAWQVVLPASQTFRAIDLSLLAASLLALACIFLPIVALSLGDHFRLESFRFTGQLFLAWATALAVALAIGKIHTGPGFTQAVLSFNSPRSIHRLLVCLSLLLLLVVFISYDAAAP